MEIKGKKAVVFGLQRSGLGAAKLLCALGASPVAVTDMRSGAELKDAVRRLPPDVELHLGGHPDSLLKDAALVVVSPGVPLGIEPLRKAREAGVEVISEVELAFRAAADERGLPEIPFYAVTGTNGKSTVVSLLDLMLRGAGGSSLMCGNIGYAVTEAFVDKEFSGFDSVVVEVSSFQLESIVRFAPRVSAVLNITADHMDRYGSAAEYAAAKARVFMNQGGEDFLVLNADDPGCMRLYETVVLKNPGGPRVLFFSRIREVEGMFLKRGEVRYSIPGVGRGLLIKKDDIRIKGVHNLENSMAAALMAVMAGVSATDTSAVLREFGGLEHRLETVRELDGVTYVNDSKGTNVGAVMKSLESFDSPVVLIAGGREKDTDFASLVPLVNERVKALVLIGEAAAKMARAFKGGVEIRMSGGMEEAVRTARAIARPGEVVLLSPGCASFDMFRDFEDRGRRFREEVMAL